MSLTLGTAPFGQRPGGRFNFDIADEERKGLLYLEDSPRRVRGRFAGETVVDSRAAKLLHEHGHLPVYYFPREDVRMDLLEPSDHRTRCPKKGEAAHWSLRVGDRVAENAAWSYSEPIPPAAPLAGYMAFYWDALDAWLEEEEEVFVHPRDPYHRVDVLKSSRHVRVSLDGKELAESRRPQLLFETGLPPRYYLPREDVRTDVLEDADDLSTRCPYKGIASYFNMRTGSEREEGLAWYYPEPLPAVAAIDGHVCFFNERVDIDVDGERLERPSTQWSGTSWLRRARG